jgi:hypothetical protein
MVGMTVLVLMFSRAASAAYLARGGALSAGRRCSSSAWTMTAEVAAAAG